MQEHLVADTVEQYVIGALDAESVRFVEGHVARCEACAALLRSEAQLELALHEVAGLHQRRVVSLASRRRRVGAVVVSAVAALAAAAVLVVLSRPEPLESSRPDLRKCDDPSTATRCIEKARFDGVLTIGPRGEPIVPRYDEVGGGAP
jgi:hypothetical protein